MRRLLIAAVLFGFAAPASAVPITYAFVQSSSTLPGLTMNASLTIDGTFADLPTINCFPCVTGTPLNFGPLLAFFFHAPAPSFFSATLASFTTQVSNPQPGAFPQWSISPSHIGFTDSIDSTQFGLDLVNGTMNFVADNGVAGCITPAACVVTGTFSPVAVNTPEPATVVLFLTGLAAIGFAQRKAIIAAVRS